MSIEQQKKIIELWRESPLTRHSSFSEKRLWSKQEEILHAYRKHKRIIVKSGNTIGKSMVAADIVMDFLTVNYPAKVITTAPSWTQVEDVLWKEIANYYNTSKIPIEGKLLNTELRFNDEWFAVGISTDTPVRMQGRHSPNLLVLIDEASGITTEIWDIVDALHPSKVVAIGNPLENSGRFYEAFQSPLWHKITVSCRECVEWQRKNGRIPGLVTQEWIDEQEQIHGKSSAYVQIHVDGEFPEESESTLVSRKWVEEARKRVNDGTADKENDDEDTSTRVVAADVATKHGTNETVIGKRYGHTIHELKGYLNIPTTSTIDKLQYEYTMFKPSTLVVDSDGIGEGVSDGLISKRISVTEFHGGYGQKAIDQVKFRNLRTQFYWIVAKKFEKGLYSLSKLDDKAYEILKNQLCSIKVKAPDAMGRIQIETKDDMAARGIKSPDYADDFMMMEYGWYMSKFADMGAMRYR